MTSGQFYCVRYIVNRWQALTEMVKSFNDAGKPGHALSVVAIVVVAGLAVALVPLLIIAL